MLGGTEGHYTVDRGIAGRVDALLGTARSVARDVSALLEPEVDITVDHWRVLRRLGQVPGAAMKDLGDTLAIPAASLTRLVDQLVDRGLVYRSTAPGDRRRVLVVRSEEGADLCERAEEIIDSAVALAPNSQLLPLRL